VCGPRAHRRRRFSEFHDRNALSSLARCPRRAAYDPIMLSRPSASSRAVTPCPPGSRVRARGLRRPCSWSSPLAPAFHRPGAGAALECAGAASRVALARNQRGAQASLLTKAALPVKPRFRIDRRPGPHTVPARLPCTCRGLRRRRSCSLPRPALATRRLGGGAALARAGAARKWRRHETGALRRVFPLGVRAARAAHRTRIRDQVPERSGGHGTSAKTFAGGGPRSAGPRCPCGVMTLKRARARGRSMEHEAHCSFYR
jgi:hypothetical protein